MSFDWNRFSTLDRVIAGAALLAFIAAFLPWYGVTVGPFSASADGWSAGFSAWAGALLLTAAGVLVVLRRSGASLQLGEVGPSVLILGVAALGLLLVIIRWISFPRYHGVDVGARYGIYVALLAGIVEVTAAVMEMLGRERALGPRDVGRPRRAGSSARGPGRASRRSRAGAGAGGAARRRGIGQRASGSSSWRLHSCQEPA